MAVPEDVRRAWGINLRAARKRAGFESQGELARALGCTRAAVSAWELGKTAPTYASRIAIARALRRATEELFPDAA